MERALYAARTRSRAFNSVVRPRMVIAALVRCGECDGMTSLLNAPNAALIALMAPCEKRARTPTAGLFSRAARLPCRSGDGAFQLACYGAGMSDNIMAAAQARAAAPSGSTASAHGTTFAVILSLSFCHLVNDVIQSAVPELLPHLYNL